MMTFEPEGSEFLGSRFYYSTTRSSTVVYSITAPSIAFHGGIIEYKNVLTPFLSSHHCALVAALGLPLVVTLSCKQTNVKSALVFAH